MSIGKISGSTRSAMASMGIGSWMVLLALLALLIAAGVLAYAGWTSEGESPVPPAGYLALALGVGFSLVVGIGLMALLFYSSRKGYDEPPMLIAPPPEEANRHVDESRSPGAADLKSER